MAVTIYDVARLAGVSPRTVSNVVNDYPHVSTATREAVQNAIAQLGYKPNSAARSLRRGRTGVIALGIPELGNPYFAELAESIIAAVARRGYTVMIERTGGESQEELKLLDERGQARLFDGLILSPVEIGGKELASLPVTMPVVLLGEVLDAGPFDHVGVDNAAAVREAIAHLAGLGRRRIAAIGHQSKRRAGTASLRTKGYRQGLTQAGLAFDRQLLVSTAVFHRHDGASAMEQLLALPERPDAVFCYNDLLAVGAVSTVLANGLRVPDDVAIVGFDDIEEVRYLTPTLTTIAPDKRAIAELAVDQLFRRLEGLDSERAEVQAPYRLELRQSTLGTDDGRRRAQPSNGAERTPAARRVAGRPAVTSG